MAYVPMLLACLLKKIQKVLVGYYIKTFSEIIENLTAWLFIHSQLFQMFNFTTYNQYQAAEKMHVFCNQP